MRFAIDCISLFQHVMAFALPSLFPRGERELSWMHHVLFSFREQLPYDFSILKSRNAFSSLCDGFLRKRRVCEVKREWPIRLARVGRGECTSNAFTVSFARSHDCESEREGGDSF